MKATTRQRRRHDHCAAPNEHGGSLSKVYPALDGRRDEDQPDAGIGWHGDKALFGQMIGVLLLSPCVFRLRRKTGEKWRRGSFIAAPRSIYLLAGEARAAWEHSIPAVDALRYSITFRSLRAP